VARFWRIGTGESATIRTAFRRKGERSRLRGLKTDAEDWVLRNGNVRLIREPDPAGAGMKKMKKLLGTYRGESHSSGKGFSSWA